MNVNALQPFQPPPASLGARRAAPPPRRPQTAASAQASARELSGSLSITTADGDRVTLSFQAAASLSSAQWDTRRGGSRQRSETSSASQALNVSVSFEGEFDQRELADIRKLLDSFTGAVGDLARNSVEGAYGRMSGLGALESLAGFTYGLQMNEASAGLVARYA